MNRERRRCASLRLLFYRINTRVVSCYPGTVATTPAALLSPSPRHRCHRASVAAAGEPVPICRGAADGEAIAIACSGTITAKALLDGHVSGMREFAQYALHGSWVQAAFIREVWNAESKSRRRLLRRRVRAKRFWASVPTTTPNASPSGSLGRSIDYWVLFRNTLFLPSLISP